MNFADKWRSLTPMWAKGWGR